MSTALYNWNIGGLAVLIPKKRGEGFLRQPYGHHAVSALSDIETSEGVDMDGLDGHLFLEYGFVTLGNRQIITDRVLPLLANHFGFSRWKEVSREEFYSHLIPAGNLIPPSDTDGPENAKTGEDERNTE